MAVKICTDCGLSITRNKTCVECGASICHRKEYCDVCGEPLPVWSTNPDRHLAMMEDHRNGWADYS